MINKILDTLLSLPGVTLGSILTLEIITDIPASEVLKLTFQVLIGLIAIVKLLIIKEIYKKDHDKSKDKKSTKDNLPDIDNMLDN